MFSRVPEYPAILWRNDPGVVANLELTRWVVPVYGLIFFGVFGFGQEAQKHYKRFYLSLVLRGRAIAKLGAKLVSGLFGSKRINSSNTPSTGVLPVYITQHITSRCDSADTFSSSAAMAQGTGGQLKSMPSMARAPLIHTGMETLTSPAEVPSLAPGPDGQNGSLRTPTESMYSTITAASSSASPHVGPSSTVSAHLGSFLDLSYPSDSFREQVDNRI